MAFRQDFILRQIEKLSQAFFQVVAGRDADREELLVIEEALSDVLKTRRQFLWSLGDEAWEVLDPAIAAEVARLWALHAVKSRRLDSARQALDCAAFALGVQLEGGGETLAMHLLDRLRDLSTIGLGRDEVAATLDQLFDHFVEHSEWAKAEDALFDRLALGDAPELRDRGIELFETLASLEDEELEEGGITREEARSTLAELREG